MIDEIKADVTRNFGMDLRMLIVNHLRSTMGDRLLTDSDIELIHFWLDQAIASHNKEHGKQQNRIKENVEIYP
jgi:hypothetical protein